MSLFNTRDGESKPTIEKYLGQGKKILVGCIQCMDHDVVATKEELDEWYDDEADHIACKVCGPEFGVALIVEEVNNKIEAMDHFGSWMRKMSELVGVKRFDT